MAGGFKAKRKMSADKQFDFTFSQTELRDIWNCLYIVVEERARSLEVEHMFSDDDVPRIDPISERLTQLQHKIAKQIVLED
jgi:hypothetical protein